MINVFIGVGSNISPETNFIIPDPDIYIRAFIAFSLFELEPNMILPDTKKPISSVADTLSAETLLPDVKFTAFIKRRNCA